MLNLKKTALAVLALSSGAVFAGTMGPVCSAVNVTIPCESTAWEFGGKALYLQPTVGGSVAQSQVRLYDTTGTNVASFGQNPPYSWGFFLEAAYHYGTGSDVNLNWYEINRKSSKSFEGGIYRTYNAAQTVYDAGYVSSNPNWNAVNLEFGQHVDFGENKSIRFHGGGQYVRLTNNTYTRVDGNDGQNDYFSTVATNPTYNGFGPRVGADMAYDWGNGLGFYANSAVAVLAGTSKSTTSITNENYRAGNETFSTTNSSTVVVPEMDTKLGATYTYAMAQGDLTLDGGWMFVNYFNAHSNLPSDTHDFSLQGPFAGLKWVGNIA